MQDNKTFLSMINNVLHTDGFYFATDYDLTHTLQRLANTSPEFQEMSLLERVKCFTTLLYTHLVSPRIGKFAMATIKRFKIIHNITVQFT